MSGLSGRVGNVVVYEMFGKTVLRSMPQKSKKKATGKRKQYQDDFRYVMKWMQYLKPLIDRCWQPLPPHKTAFKPAFSYHLKRYREMDRPSHYEWIDLTKGDIAGLENVKLQFDDRLLQIDWEEGQKEIIHPRDLVYIKLVNVTKGQSYPQLMDVERQETHFELLLRNWSPNDQIVAVMLVASYLNPALFSKTYVLVK